MALSIKVSVSPSKVKPGGGVQANFAITNTYQTDVQCKATWYRDNKAYTLLKPYTIRAGSTIRMARGFPAPDAPGVHTIRAEVYRLSTTGEWILEDSAEVQYVVEEPEEYIGIQSEDSTVSISGYDATIHGRVTIKSSINTTVYPAVVHYGGMIILDPISITAGTKTYTYTRKFNFKEAYEFLRKRGMPTDAELLYLKSDKRTVIKGDVTKFKLEPTGVVTDWSVKADKTTVKPGDTLTIQATVNWVGKSMKFKLGIDAFGKHYESTEVTATASPTIIKVPITVPAVKEGTYEIKVTLYYE